jgi:nucleotide-binding universal stress UspA family protein
MVDDLTTYQQALTDFRRARSKAAMQRFWASIQGKSLNLLPYDKISSTLQAINRTDIGLQNVKLKDIIGSVGRADDFTSDFLPLRDTDIHRWAQVKTAMTSPASAGVPPVHLYKVGDAYFVLDGNHRVSIAKQMGMEEIEAYVTEFKTRVPITSSITPEELILKSKYVEFLNNTRLDQILPNVDFSLNYVENYPLLEEHIAVHRYYMGIEQQREISYEEAVCDWYENVYLPVVKTIESSGLRNEFKDMTVTDLYLWVLDQQTLLQEALGIPISTEHAAEFMALHEGKQIKAPTSRGEQHFDETVFSVQPAEAINAYLYSRMQNDCLFRDILVAIGDHDETWNALEEAILINCCPNGHIRGLHVIHPEDRSDDETYHQMEARFTQRLEEVGIDGKLLFVKGDITSRISEHSLLSDLLVMRLNFPPSGGLIDRLTSGITSILRSAKRPVLMVKEKVLPLDKALIVYDGSPKSKEALFIGAYYAARWGTQLALFTLDDGSEATATEISYAKTYLRKLNLDFEYMIKRDEPLVEAILETAGNVTATMILMGGYSGDSIFDRIFGSHVDALLKETPLPILISQ